MGNKKIWPLLFCLIVVLLFADQPAQAGDGSGGGRNNPLTLVSSTPTHGEKDVPLIVEIQLSFSKNVVHMTVRDLNMECFSLVDAQGNPVAVDVMMADDQVEPEKRRDVCLKPLQELEPGVEYTVKVAPSFQSKSEVSLGEVVQVTFTTEKSPASNEVSSDQQAGRPEAGDQEGSRSISLDAPVSSPASQGKEVNVGQEVGKSAEDQGRESITLGAPEDGEKAGTLPEGPDTTVANDTLEEVDTGKPPADGKKPGLLLVGVIILAAVIGFSLFRLFRTR